MCPLPLHRQPDMNQPVLFLTQVNSFLQMLVEKKPMSYFWFSLLAGKEMLFLIYQNI